MNNKHSLDFGKKEKVLNYATQTYQLSRPSKVGAVMAVLQSVRIASLGRNAMFPLNPASRQGCILTGCKGRDMDAISTERYIPDGMLQCEMRYDMKYNYKL
jgi:hypothetical protein